MLSLKKPHMGYILGLFSLVLLLIPRQTGVLALDITVTPSPQPTNYGGGHGRILIQMYGNQSVNLYTVDMNGVEKSLVLGNLLLNMTPAWSPNGKRIAFSMVRNIQSDDSIGDIYVINAD